MVDEKVRLIMGSLLHDTGKVIYRQGMTGVITVFPGMII